MVVAPHILARTLGGVLRPVDFIYRTAGVARPLQQNELDPKANLNHTYYRDQLNKVVRGTKDLVSGMQMPASRPGPVVSSALEQTVPPASRKKIVMAAATLIFLAVAGYFIFNLMAEKPTGQDVEKSIAVLAFQNMSSDKEQEYFSDGISEEIINLLAKVKDLKVAGRTPSASPIF